MVPDIKGGVCNNGRLGHLLLQCEASSAISQKSNYADKWNTKSWEHFETKSKKRSIYFCFFYVLDVTSSEELNIKSEELSETKSKK